MSLDEAIERCNKALDELERLTGISTQIIVEDRDFILISKQGIETFRIKEEFEIEDYITNRAKRFEIMAKMTKLKDSNLSQALIEKRFMMLVNKNNLLALKGIDMTEKVNNNKFKH